MEHGAVGVEGVVQDFAEAATRMGGDGGSVAAADVDVDFFTFRF